MSTSWEPVSCVVVVYLDAKVADRAAAAEDNDPLVALRDSRLCIGQRDLATNDDAK